MSAMAPQADVLLGAPDAQHPFLVGEPGQELVGDVVLAPASRKTDQFQSAGGDEAVMSARNALVIGSLNAVGAW